MQSEVFAILMVVLLHEAAASKLPFSAGEYVLKPVGKQVAYKTCGAYVAEDDDSSHPDRLIAFVATRAGTTETLRGYINRSKFRVMRDDNARAPTLTITPTHLVVRMNRHDALAAQPCIPPPS